MSLQLRAEDYCKKVMQRCIENDGSEEECQREYESCLENPDNY